MANFTWPTSTFLAPPASFISDGNTTSVSIDTVTPANSTPLPVISLDASGNPVPVFDPTTIETYLSQIDADTSAISSDTATLAAVDYATETTLNDVFANTTILINKDFATETTLASLNGKDFATEATLANILADTTSLAGKDFATQTTLASVLADTTSLVGKDFATETTLSSILADTTSINGKDFATYTEQSFQSTLLSEISDNQLSFVDPNNTSITPLGANDVFTGDAIEITNYASISIAAFSDVSSAAGGLSMQFSPDAANWDHKHDFNVTGNVGVSYNQSCELRYFRVVYTNGSSAQTTFRLTTVVKRTNTTPSKYSLEQAVNGAMMADLTKSVIWGLSSSGGGTYHTVKVTPSGAIAADVSGTVAATQSGTWNINNISGTVSLPTGAATLAEQQTQSSSLSTIAGKDFATQTTLAAMSAKLPTTLGQTTKGGSLSVTVASDQTVDVKQSGRAKVAQLFNDYTTTSVSTSAYTELTASTSATVSRIEIFDSSGECMILAVGGAGSEVDQLYIFPGGNGPVDLLIPSGSRISVKAKTAAASVGFLAINLYA